MRIMTARQQYSRSQRGLARSSRSGRSGYKRRVNKTRNTVITAIILGVLAWLLVPGLGPDILGLDESGIPGGSSNNGQNPDLVAQLDSLPISRYRDLPEYQRYYFGSGWEDLDNNGCNTRNEILARDLHDVTYRAHTNQCVVDTGVLDDPYTGEVIAFRWGEDTSSEVQIDHVVPLANAWYAGAYDWDSRRRLEFANDPLNLLAASGETNFGKGAHTADQWLPPNRPFQCDYVARQVMVKHKYGLTVTSKESEAMKEVLWQCPPMDTTRWGQTQ